MPTNIPANTGLSEAQVLQLIADNPSPDAVRSDAEIDALIDAKLSAPFIAPDYENGWADFSAAAWMPGGYRKLGNKVEIQGMVKGGANNTVLFTLPVGFRPKKATYAAIMPGSRSANTYVRVQILADGRVRAARVGGDTTGDFVWLSLAGIQFEAA